MSTRSGIVGGMVGAGVVAALSMAVGAAQLDPPDRPVEPTTRNLNDVFETLSDQIVFGNLALADAIEASSGTPEWRVLSGVGTFGPLEIQGAGIIHRIIIVPNGNAVVNSFSFLVDDQVVVSDTDGQDNFGLNRSAIAVSEHVDQFTTSSQFGPRRSVNPVNIRFEEDAIVNWTAIDGLSPGSARVIVLYRLDDE
ncbi:MAG: hypothetical protein AAFO89_09375 [Planctomycetota bacterium]